MHVRLLHHLIKEKQKMISRLCAFVILISIWLQAEAASIGIVSGSLTALPNVTEITGFGDFTVSNHDVVGSSASASITASRIDINASTGGIYDPFTYNYVTSSVSGVVDFTLLAVSNAHFNFLGSIFPGGSNANASLFGPGGALILQCQNEFATDCFGPGWNGGRDESQLSDSLVLDAGNYHLIFDTYSEVAMSNIWDGNLNMSLDLHPVPVPATVWLFGSGLLGFFAMVRRRI
jgi:hypothetical protein